MIEFSQPEVATGKRIRGTVKWTAQGKSPRALKVMMAWRTVGPGETDSRVLKTIQHEVAPSAAGTISLPFEFEVPAEGPISYDGTLIRILWEIAVLADIPWALDEFEHAPFRVVPHRA